MPRKASSESRRAQVAEALALVLAAGWATHLVQKEEEAGEQLQTEQRLLQATTMSHALFVLHILGLSAVLQSIFRPQTLSKELRRDSRQERDAGLVVGCVLPPLVLLSRLLAEIYQDGAFSSVTFFYAWTSISVGVSALLKVAVFGSVTSLSVNVLVDGVLLPTAFGLLTPVEAEWRFLLATGGRVFVATVLAADLKLLPRSFTVGEALLVAQGVGLCAYDLVLSTVNWLNEVDVIDLPPNVLHPWLLFDMDRPDYVLALQVGMLGSLLVCIALIPLLRLYGAPSPTAVAQPLPLRGSVGFVLTAVAVVGGVVYPWSCFLLQTWNPFGWLFDFLSESRSPPSSLPPRFMLMGYWATCLVVLVPLFARSPCMKPNRNYVLADARPDSLPTQTGAFISVISCSVIVLSFLLKRKWRRHPNPLIYWKAVVDLLYALRFQYSWDVYTNALGCRALATFTQFCLFSSECWFLCMSFNLYQCSTNPFTNLKLNLQWYHTFSWGVGALFAALLWVSSVEFDPKVHAACFVDETVADELVMHYIVVILAVLCAVVFAVLETQTHPFRGMKEALEAKKDVIRSARIFTVAYIIYQIILISFWLADVLFLGDHPRALHLVRDASSFLQTAKGLIDLVIWVAINGYPHVDCRARETFDSDRYSDVDIDLQPQLNVALRKEVLHFTTRGIVAASSNTPMVTDGRRVVHLRLHELGMTVCFDDYSPSSFRDIRQGFGINETLYRKAFLATCHERLESGGSSGAFMFYTADYSFLVKSVTTSERNVLLDMLPAYIRHMKLNPESHLTRFYGCHSIEMYGQVFSFVVMGNVMGRTSMHQFFDIKGSWVDRNAPAIPPGKTVICTYCSNAFQYGTNESCEYSLRGNHLPHIVLKDNDFHRKLRVPSDIAQALVRQLDSDSNFLREQGIMDYSLMLSVHNTKYVVEHTATDARLQSPTKRKVNYPVCHPDSDTFLSIATDGAEPTEGSSDEDLDEVESGNRRKFNRNCRYSVVNQLDDSTVTIQDDTPLLGRSMRRYNSVSYGPADMSSHTFDDSQWIGTRTVDKRGYQACVVVGPDYYTLGVVDMLQTWTWRKRLERLWKTLVLRHDGLGISAAPPKLYAQRFQHKMRDILMVSSASVSIDSN